MIRVYIAAPFPLQAEALQLESRLARHGIGCTARWLTAPENSEDAWARRCLEDVAACDVFLALNPSAWHDKGTGGRHVELGFAIARGKPVVVVGVRSNIFHHLSGVRVVDIDEAVLVGLVTDSAGDARGTGTV